MTESALRDLICQLAKSLYDRGLTHGSTGNISARTQEGGLMVTPTNASFGRLDPDRLSLFDADGLFISGDPPTKEILLHRAFYETRSKTGAVVHLHSCHAVALSLLDADDPDNFLPPYTPYAVMKLGRVQLLPYFMPGDQGMADAVRGLAGKRSAVMLANHGPVVAGRDVESACYAVEELEESAKLALMMRGLPANRLDEQAIANLVTKFDVEWDD